MPKDKNGLSRREFLQTGLSATTAAAALGSGIAGAKVPAQKTVTLSDQLPARILGKTGLRVPVLGFGSSPIVERWGGVGSLEDRMELVRYAYDRGVRWFDTADNYSESEGIIGTALKDVRDDVFLATKVSVIHHQGVRRMFERSLERLQTDYVDSIQIHGTTGIEQMSFEEAMKVYEELVKLREEGLARFIGVTGHNYFHKLYALIATGEFDTAFLANGYFKFGMVQLLTNEAVELREMCLTKTQELGMGSMAMKVMRGGLLGQEAKRVVPDWDADKVARLPGAAIRYVLQNDRVHTLNIGMRIKSDVDANVAILSGDTTFTEADRFLLAEFSAKAYPWYEEQIRKWREQRQEQEAEGKKE